MSNIIKLKTTDKEFNNIQELIDYSSAQYLALESAVKKIKILQEEVQHLQQLLASTTELIEEDSKVQKIIKAPELCIIEAQIDILQNRALQKELTLEEVKVLDLLIKNKALLSGEPTTVVGQRKKNKSKYSEAELILIASDKEGKNGKN